MLISVVHMISQWIEASRNKALTLAYFMNMYSLIKNNIQNNLFNHFYISGNLLNSAGLARLQTQLISLFPRILLVAPGIFDIRNIILR